MGQPPLREDEPARGPSASRPVGSAVGPARPPNPAARGTPPQSAEPKAAHSKWTREEELLLGTASDEAVARQLGRTRVAVLMRRTQLGIVSANLRGPTLSPEQQAQLAAPDPTILQELQAASKQTPPQPLSPKDQERFRLLHGPYYPPRTRRGAFLACQWRGTVKVGGYSQAPVPWPFALRTGCASLILCGDLVRAVRVESEQAITYHWHVSKATVRKWRQVLGVEMWNEGSGRLLAHAVELARTPEAREKIAQAAVGRVLTPEHREKLRALNSRPKSEAMKQRMSERRHAALARGQRSRPWSPEEDALLGTLPDRELAKKLGRSRSAVAGRRFGKRARARAQLHPPVWDADQDALVRRGTLVQAARQLQRPLWVVQERRRALGVARMQPRALVWTAEQDDIVRRQTIEEAARLLGRSTSTVEKRRRKLGLTHPPVPGQPWAPEEIRLLGTKPDRLLARRFKRRTAAVRQKRLSLGIPICSEKHVWLPADDVLLGKYPDDIIARFLKISVAAVKTRRLTLAIPIKDPKTRPWTPEDDALLGTVPDPDLAARLGRSLVAVRCRRAQLGIPGLASRSKVWTAAEEALLGTQPDEAVAARLKRSLSSVKAHRYYLGLPRHGG